ncbi:MAG: GNAT family N-acetyltransferase [Deltaproteobacteria bacterium]|nr:GNAT family N-acetyltransferase [Deltaproteobacteria bacterium]
MKNPFLVDKQFYLKPLELSDLSDSYLGWFNDQEICRYNSHAVFPMTMADMEAYIKRTAGSRSELAFAIRAVKNDRHIGNVALQNINWVARSAEFSILIGDKKYWGKNIGYTAGKLLMEYGRDRLNLRRISCGTHAENTGMRNLALKLGMKQEGVRKEAYYKEGKYSDLIEYGVVFK